MSLRLDHVHKRFGAAGAERVALDDVSLELDRGRLIGVHGPSGAGKTTLLRVAAGLLAPDAGTVLYDNVGLGEMSASERRRYRRRTVACVWAAESWQERLSVLDHVALPLLVDGHDRASARRRARESLLACEAEQCVEVALEELSEGQRQRVSIARALVCEPRLLIADSPASRLAALERHAVMTLLSCLAHRGGAAVLVADSDVQSLLGCDELLYLHDGRLTAPEAPPELGRLYRLPSARAADG